MKKNVINVFGYKLNKVSGNSERKINTTNGLHFVCLFFSKWWCKTRNLYQGPPVASPPAKEKQFREDKKKFKISETALLKVQRTKQSAVFTQTD